MEKMRKITGIVDIVVFVAATLAIAGVFYEGMTLKWYNFVGILVVCMDYSFMPATLLHLLSDRKEKTIWLHLFSLMIIIIAVIMKIASVEYPAIALVLWYFLHLVFLWVSDNKDDFDQTLKRWIKKGRESMIKGIHHISMKCNTEEEIKKVKDFYISRLGLKIVREWPDGFMIDTGSGYIEIFTNADGEHRLGSIRHFALLTDDVDSIAEKVKSAGYELFVEPNDRVIKSDPEYPIRMAFCYGPLGEQIEFFCER